MLIQPNRIMANLLNVHKANKIENKDVEFAKLHRRGINFNFRQLCKKVANLTYKRGGGDKTDGKNRIKVENHL